MQNCQKCSYKLVLLSYRRKYKCSLCSTLYHQKDIESKTFQKWNQQQRKLNKQQLAFEDQRRKQSIEEKKLFTGFRKLFKNHKTRRFILLTKEERKQRARLTQKKWRKTNQTYDQQRKQEYYQQNKHIINLKITIKRRQNREIENQKNKAWRDKNLTKMRIYGMIQDYRRQQKALALHYLKNEEYKPSNTKIFSSVPTNLLADLL